MRQALQKYKGYSNWIPHNFIPYILFLNLAVLFLNWNFLMRKLNVHVYKYAISDSILNDPIACHHHIHTVAINTTKLLGFVAV